MNDLWSNAPVFCFTSDIDWASEAVIQYSHEILNADRLRLTYFNTHPSLFLKKLASSNRARILIHPNFLPDSSQGTTFKEVIDYCINLEPTADGFRSHRYFEVNDIMDDLVKRGFKFVSNHCTRCEPCINPLMHRSGLLSLPIFLEDGGYLLMDPSLDMAALDSRLGTPGLKIINYHAAHMAFNTPYFAYTRKLKDSMTREAWNNIGLSDLQKVEYKGFGIRNVILGIIEFALRNNHVILSMHDIYNEHTNNSLSAKLNKHVSTSIERNLARVSFPISPNSMCENRKSLHLIVGARPNFMKIAPIIRALQGKSDKIRCSLVHTGQHYDKTMSDVFIHELGIPEPDHNLGCVGGSHAEQAAKIMLAYEKLCLAERPDMVLVVGDVNSTLACSIVAKKLLIPVAHVEAGLRSGDRTMPEEINRLVTDAISDIFFVTEPSGVENLRKEGKPEKDIHFVGHVMVDNLIYQRDLLDNNPLTVGASIGYKRQTPEYGVVTLHRPSNVDAANTFQDIASALRDISCRLPLVFPVHPRTRLNLERFQIDLGEQITLLEPLGYMDFLNLWRDATLVLTDSGGLQEETTALGVPCITIRENTERPITITEGTNVLAGTDPAAIAAAALDVLNGKAKAGKCPNLWDGHAAERIVQILVGS